MIMSKDSNGKYVTIPLIAIVTVLIGALLITQALQTVHAQNTSGQVSQKLGNISGATNKTGNQSSNPLAKIGEALKGMFRGK